MKAVLIFLFVATWMTVDAEIRLLMPYDKQEFVVPHSYRPKCREHPAVHIDFRWTPTNGARSYVLVIEKQKVTKHDDGYERVYYDPLIKSDETTTQANRYFYDSGLYRWSVMGRNARGDLDRESEYYHFNIT